MNSVNWLALDNRSYWIVFITTFLLVGWWENHAPERAWRISPAKRWSNHFLLFLVLSLLRPAIRLSTPMVAAIGAEGAGWGALPRLGVPVWLGAVLTLLALDLLKYGLHRLFHTLPWMWRVHRVHHSDPDFDVATSLRFHPVEPLLVLAGEVGFIWLLGAPPAGVFLSGIASNFVNTVQHANANLPGGWEGRLQRWVMTARVHRIHHSDAWSDEHTNFGEIIPLWDRLFGTYRWTAERGSEMQVGLAGYETEQSVGLVEMLTQPLKAERPQRGS